MAEQTEMDKLVEEMMEHICDELCRHPREAQDPEQLEDVCAECGMGKFVCGILNMYTGRGAINDKEQGDSGAD